MFSAILPFTRERRRHMGAVRDLGDALNRRDMAAAGAYLHPDLVLVDQSGYRIDGREAYLAAQSAFFAATGNPRIVFESVDPNRDEVLVRGRLEGGKVGVGAPTMWRISFHGPLITQIEITRSGDGMTVPRFAERIMLADSYPLSSSSRRASQRPTT